MKAQIGDPGQPQGGGRPVRVLVSFAGLYPTTNPYITQLARAFGAHAGIEMILFSWRRALLGGYDVFHVHWPEQLMGGHRRSGRVVRRLLTILLLLRLRLTGTPLVRTLHNIERPSGLAGTDHLLLDGLDARTRVWIRVNPATQTPADAYCATILLGDYRDWYAAHPRSAPISGRVAYVGLVRGYKGVEDLIAGFSDVEDDTLSLMVAGRPTSAELSRRVTELADGDSRITLRLEYLDEDDFVTAVTSAEIVALPYRFMHNSSAVLAALSLDRPVLVPDNVVNRLLAEEVGPGWIHLYEGDLDGIAIRRAFDAVRAGGRTAAPDLSARSWAGAAEEHERAFRRALSEAGKRRTPVRDVR